MSLFLGRFYVVFYHKMTSWDTYNVQTWWIAVLRNGLSQKLLLKVKIIELTHRKLVTENMIFFAIFCFSLCTPSKWEIKLKALNIGIRKKYFLYEQIYVVVYNTRFTKLVRQLHLGLKMLSPVSVYLLKNWNCLWMNVAVTTIKIILMSQVECWLDVFSRRKTNNAWFI